MGGEEGRSGEDRRGSGPERGEPWPDPESAESRADAEGDDAEYREWDRVSDPPEPTETLGSWSPAARDRVVAGLVFLLFVAYGVLRADTIAADPGVAAVYGLATLVTVNLLLPEVRERIPLLSNPRTAFLLGWLIPLVLVAEIETGRAVAFLAFLVLMWAGMAVIRRLTTGRSGG